MHIILFCPEPSGFAPVDAMHMLILYYDNFFGRTMRQEVDLPAGCEVTSDRRFYSEAAAVVFHIPAWKRKPGWMMPRKLPGQLWVAWSMESAENHPKLKDPEFMKRFDLTMTYKADADVRTPYLDYYARGDQLSIALRAPAETKIPDPPAAVFISSTADKSDRITYTRELSRYINIHSYGRVLNNIRIQNDEGRQSKLQQIKKYRFTLAFENAIDRDYVTEKFFDPLVSGSVPVYLGAPNIQQFAPGEHCFINVADFVNPRALAEYLIELCHDDAAYGAYFAWKQQPFSADFCKLADLARVPVQYQLCLAVQAVQRRYYPGGLVRV